MTDQKNVRITYNLGYERHGRLYLYLRKVSLGCFRYNCSRRLHNVLGWLRTRRSILVGAENRSKTLGF